MPQLFILCPETGKEVYTGLNMDWFDLDAYDLKPEPLECPHCDGTHSWTKDDVQLRADGAGD